VLSLLWFAPAKADMYPDASNAKLPDARTNLAIAPHVATNAALTAAATASYPSGVWRDDYATGNGAPPLWYRPGAGVCLLNAGNGDNGSQVKSADGKCWLAAFPAAGMDVREFGASETVSDNTSAVNAALATGTKSILFPSGTFNFSAGLSYTFSANLRGLTILGAGQDLTVLHFPSVVGAALTITKNQFSQSVHIRDLTMTTGQVAADVGIHVNQTKIVTSSSVQSGYSQNDITRVTMRGDDGYWEQDQAPAQYPVNNWKTGIQLTNDSIYDLVTITVNGPKPIPGTTATGILLEATTSTTVPVIFNVSRANLSWMQYGIVMKGVQGLQVSSSNIVGNIIGIYTPTSAVGTPMAELIVTGSQFNNGSNIVLNARVGGVILGNNLFYTRENPSVLLTVGTETLNITGNMFEQALTAGGGKGIEITPEASGDGDVFPAIITSNSFSKLGTGVHIGSATNGVIVSANRFIGNTTNVQDDSGSGQGAITGATSSGASSYINVSGAVNNGTGQTRITVASTSGFVTGLYVLVGGVGGIGNIGTNQYLLTPVKVIDATHMDLLLVNFSGTYTSGGFVSSLPP
jgi:hypothetical protein